MLGRRDLLKLAATSLLVPACGDDFVDVCAMPVGDDLDTALAALHAMDPEFGGGLSNHGPMAAEVLHHSGRADRICGWTGDYAGKLSPLVAGQPLPASERTSALGAFTRRAEWIAAFAEEVTGDLAQLLATALPMLLPGFAGASFHGALRTGHALRALAASDTPQRRTELAHGLGYWAARHTPLPGAPGSAPVTGQDVVQSLALLSMAENQQSGGFVHARIAKVNSHPAFIDEVAGVDFDVWSLEQTLTELAAAAARLFIADGNRDDLGYLHAFDATSIVRPMLPFMDAPTRRLALISAFHGVAAVHVTHGSGPGVPDASYPAHDPAELARRGAAADDEHTIKLVEACVREYAIDPRPEFLEAAARRLD